jgi:hypothetical protein
MYNLDYFSYWKEPIVRIKRIGIYPLDDEGREKYYSKDSFTHHYLRKVDPSIFKQIVMNTDINEAENEKNEKKLETIDNQQNLNTISAAKEYDGLKTEPNQDISQTNLKNNNTISSTSNKNRVALNQRYIDNINKKKKLNNLRYKSYSNSKKNKTLYSQKENNKILGKTFMENSGRKMGQSFDKSARLTGLTVFKDRKPRVNLKLPLIMGGFNHENNNRINMIRTGTKEMGENYNPYNFIAPHVNRTKRNYVGGLFHG